MIKVYAVCFSNNPSKPIFSTPKSRLSASWRNGYKYDYEMTSDIAEAKHYETASRAKTVIRNLKNRITDSIVELENKIKECEKTGNGGSYWNNRHKEELKSLKEFSKNYYDNMSVVEYQVEQIDESNTNKVEKKRLKWRTNYDGSAIKRGHCIVTETHSRHHCKMCGVVLKNIPQVQIGGVFGGIICVRCGMAIGDDSRRAWEAIPEKETLEKEFFVHNLG